MKKRRAFALAPVGALLLVLAAGPAAAQAGGTATAELADTDGNQVGTAEFVEGPEGVTITANLQPGQNVAGPGAHGVHIHETGQTSPDFEAAGKHFDPTSAQHGLQNPDGPHAGDLEEMVVNDDGSANYQTLDDRVTLSEGPRSLLDSDGSALVIHAGSDDQETDPSGNSGGRVIAGVIRLAQTGEPTTPAGGTTAPAGGVTSPGGNLPTSGGPNLILPLAALVTGAGALAAAVLIRRLRYRA